MAILVFEGKSFTELKNSQANRKDSTAPAFGSGMVVLGIGTPLLVEVEYFYSGNAPKTIFNGKRDALVVSGFKKGLMAFDASPRYIHFVERKVGDKTIVDDSAFLAGTKVAFYSPALDTDKLLFSFQAVFDKFEKEKLDELAAVTQAAAGMPVFASASGYLIAGAMLLKIGGRLAAAIQRESAPFLTDDYEIDLSKYTTYPEHLIICNDKDRDQFKSAKCYPGPVEITQGRTAIRLLDASNNEEYRPNAPYMLLRFSTAERPELLNFTPRAVTAALLEKFYAQDPAGNKKAMAVLQDAVVLYNDLFYATQAKTLSKQLVGLATDSNKYKLISKQIAALIKNIQTSEFKVNL